MAAPTLTAPRQRRQTNSKKDLQTNKPHKQELGGEQEEAKEEDEAVGEHEELVLSIYQRTVRRLTTVQLTVVKSEAELLRSRSTRV